MIRKFPIIIACAPEDAPYYHNFPLPNEELQVVPYGQAVCSVLSQEIDLMIIDCGFDARLGLRLLEDLKTRFSGVPILFATEQSSEEIILRAFKLGARDFFQKPLSVFNVRSTMMELLKAKREVREHLRVPNVGESEQPLSGALCQVGVLQPAIMKVVCHIESNYQMAISLDQMASLASMSKYHFVRLFRREAGMSPIRYLKFVRIQRAKELLKRSDLTVFSAALRVGFQDVSNFNKNFKNIEGCTPSQYRSKLL
jgi:AraC-like DNA-binding protein